MFCIATPIPRVYSTISGALSINSSTYVAPHNTEAHFYYELFQITSKVSGTYVFSINGSIDTLLYVFNNSVDPSNANDDLLSDNEFTTNHVQYQLVLTGKHEHKLVLLITTELPFTSVSFLINIMGPASIHFIPMINITLPHIPKIGK